LEERGRDEEWVRTILYAMEEEMKREGEVGSEGIQLALP
jgi:hypothetical protein